MIPTLVFDIETIPDTDGLRRLLDLPSDTSAEDVANVAFHQRRQQNGSEFLALQHHRVVAISCVLRDSNGFRVWSLGSPDEPEGQLIQRFYDGIERYTPNLVSWNGNGFDLPVLHYRGLIHQVHAARYWDMGEQDRDFKFNNYISRYHTRHLDLMDVLALYQGRGNAPLDEIAQLCGFPGKLGMDMFDDPSEHFSNPLEQQSQNPKILSVTELNQLARQLLENSFQQCWVSGEISNLTRASSGHWYFSLKDAQAQVRCVMFRGRNQSVDWIVQEGDRVEARVNVTLYEARGDFQLNIEQMQRAGAGTLFEAFEKLKLKLQQQGLFDPARKRSIPTFPKQIGIVTSTDAAALHDVLTTLKRRMPNIPVVIYPTPVQGKGAAEQIATHPALLKAIL